MPLVIHALDDQFAVATGSNVSTTASTSTFDYPPNSTKDLVISAQPGDPSPYIFSPGDVYSISFGGNGGTTLQDAVVIRSDVIGYGGDSGFSVVFEGTDPAGNLVQVVWTPEFNLESWYWDNFSAGNPPGFYTSDLSARSTYQMACFEADTLIDTPDGPRPAASLQPGDRVATRDHGACRLRWVARLKVPGCGRGAPVWIERGVIGNHAALTVSRQHRLLLASPIALARYGSAEVLVPAAALLNGATVRLAPRPQIGYVHLLFDGHEIVIAEGAPAESLLFGKMTARHLPGRIDGLTPALARLAQTPCRPLLRLRQAETLWADMQGTGGPRALFGHRGMRRMQAFVFVPKSTGARPNCHGPALAPYAGSNTPAAASHA